MATWVCCRHCGLHHPSREDGLCPRCGTSHSGTTPAAGAPHAAVRASPPPPAPAPPLAVRASPGLAAAAPKLAPASPPLPPSPPPLAVAAPPPSTPAVPDGFAAAREAFRAPPRRRTLLWLGIASAIAFLLIGILDMKPRVAMVLALILLVHELGHWVAMRLSGQQDVRIFFIPFFGAVTTARSVPTTAGVRAAIALAGPIPGIVFGVVLARLFPTPGLGRGVAVMLLYLNVFNLLPIGFLDGGKVVSTLFLARVPVLEGAFAVASAVPLGVLFSGKGSSGSGIMGGLVVGILFAAVRRYRVAGEARGLEAALAGQRDPLALDDTALRPIYQAALRIAAKDKRVKGAGPVAAVMREIFDAACAPRPTPAEQVGYGFAWAAALAVGWTTLAAAGVHLLS